MTSDQWVDQLKDLLPISEGAERMLRSEARRFSDDQLRIGRNRAIDAIEEELKALRTSYPPSVTAEFGAYTKAAWRLAIDAVKRALHRVRP